MSDTSSLADIKARHEDGLPDEHDLGDAFIRLPNAAWIPDDFRALEAIADRAVALLVALKRADDDCSQVEESQASAAVSQWNSTFPREVLTTDSALALYDALKALEQAIGGGS